MQKSFVKASGGCSTPVDNSKWSDANVGEMRIRVDRKRVADTVRARVMIAHPNITGLQLDQTTKGYPPPYFINKIMIKGDGVELLHIESDISISMNPTYDFYIDRGKTQALSITAWDNNDNVFTKDFITKK